MSLREQLYKTAVRFLDAHNDRDVPAIIASCSQNCTHRTGPRSISTPDRNNHEYSAFSKVVYETLHTYHAEVTDSIIDETKCAVALYVHAKATADAGDYDNEYIIILTMTDDGLLVRDQYDFIDSYTMTQWIETLGSFAKKHWETR